MLYLLYTLYQQVKASHQQSRYATHAAPTFVSTPLTLALSGHRLRMTAGKLLAAEANKYKEAAGGVDGTCRPQRGWSKDLIQFDIKLPSGQGAFQESDFKDFNLNEQRGGAALKSKKQPGRHLASCKWNALQSYGVFDEYNQCICSPLKCEYFDNVFVLTLARKRLWLDHFCRSSLHVLGQVVRRRPDQTIPWSTAG